MCETNLKCHITFIKIARFDTPLVGSGLNHTLSLRLCVSRSLSLLLSVTSTPCTHLWGPRGSHVNQSAACSACAPSAPQHIYPRLPATITAVLVLKTSRIKHCMLHKCHANTASTLHECHERFDMLVPQNVM